MYDGGGGVDEREERERARLTAPKTCPVVMTPNQTSLDGALVYARNVSGDEREMGVPQSTGNILEKCLNNLLEDPGRQFLSPTVQLHQWYLAWLCACPQDPILEVLSS